MLQNFLDHLGIYYAKKRYMAHGIDWLWDIRRLIGRHQLHTIFDVGANVGQTSSELHRHFPSTSIHAFEPVGATYKKLREKVSRLKGVYAYQLALSSTMGSSRMRLEENSQLSRFVSTAESESVLDDYEIVSTVTIDRFCDTHKLGSIDILKIDTEGHDLQVLQGAQNMLAQKAVGFVFVETCFNERDTVHSYFPHIFQYLVERGFQLNCFYDHYFADPRHLELLFLNALFVNSEAVTSIDSMRKH